MSKPTPSFYAPPVPFTTYMLHCADRTFYVGHTDDPERRLAQHQRGELPGYTHTRRPVVLVWSEAFSTRDEALAAERQIKGWSKAKKLALIRGDWARISTLAKSHTSTPVLDEEKESPSTSSGRTGVGNSKLTSPENQAQTGLGAAPNPVRAELVEAHSFPPQRARNEGPPPPPPSPDHP